MLNEAHMERELLPPLIERFKTLESILSTNSYIQDITRRLNRVIEDATSHVQILVLGKERVGKTSIINGLLGRELLPSSVENPTEVNTFIKYGEQEHIEAVFYNGYVAQFELNKIDLLVNSHVELAEIIREPIDHIIIYIKHDLLKMITLVDTTALELIDNETAYFSDQLINRVDEIFWVIRGNSPATEDELKLLKKIASRNIKPYFIVNAIDECEQGIDTFISMERARYGNYISDIIGVSAKQALVARKTNNTQQLIDSRYTTFTQLIQTIAKNSDKKDIHSVQQLGDWLHRLRKEIENIPVREPYISALEKVEKHNAEAMLESTREQRDLAIVKIYELEYEQISQSFKAVQTLYQLLQILSAELYLRDEETEQFEELATIYQQHVRAYRNLHSEYEAHFGVIQKSIKKHELINDELHITLDKKINILQAKDKIFLLNEKQKALSTSLEIIKDYEIKVSQQIYSVQNRLMQLITKRLKNIIHQIGQLNNQRKSDIDTIISYSNKLSEFSCVTDAQTFLTNAIKPYIESDQFNIEKAQKQQMIHTIDLICGINLQHTKISTDFEDEKEQVKPIFVDFEEKYKLYALRLTEKDVLSVVPDLPAIVVQKD